MDTYECDKYICSNENDEIKKTLDKYGVAIVLDVLDDAECEEMISGMWDYLEHITSKKIKRDDQTTWVNITDLFPLHSMLIQHWCIGHSDFVWKVRQNMKVIEVFANIYNVKPEDLLVSFDGASIHMPPEITKRGWNRNNTWFHSDQSFKRNDFECVQGWVTSYDVNVGDSTLAFLEGSHNYHKEFSEKTGVVDTKDWYKLNEKEFEFFKSAGCEEKRIKCPRGSLVLWDSRTIHCGTEAFKQRAKSNFRCIVYVCYQPRNLCNEKNIVKKRKAFEEMRMTTHWPCKIKLFPKTPRTFGRELPEFKTISKPMLTDIGLRLAGF
jgi:ectoine hydroxylase-related dioxygenase (phytanoyl-CoA dioxygenase family)